MVRLRPRSVHPQPEIAFVSLADLLGNRGIFILGFLGPWLFTLYFTLLPGEGNPWTKEDRKAWMMACAAFPSVYLLIFVATLLL